jgi:hypothetical protein
MSPSSSRLPYALAGLVVLFELCVLWLVLHPDVNGAYRAFYIDKSSTCLPQPVSGDYVLGTTVSFRDPARLLARPLKPCGWFIPNGDHTPSKGTSSLLRFAIPLDPGPLSLRLELDPVTSDAVPLQRIDVSIGGTVIRELSVLSGPNRFIHVPLPAALTQRVVGPLDILLSYPDAMSFAPGNPDTQARAFKVRSVRLVPVGARWWPTEGSAGSR